MSSSQLDPYTAKAENTDITPQHKVEGLLEVTRGAKTAMVTTKAKDGHLHSRAMTPAGPVKGENTLHFVFLGNNVSAKFSEIENDAHVNVSFYDNSTTNWASISGIAKISQDKEKIKAHWSTTVGAYFCDLGDGVHRGNADDPRVSIIEVVPDEIRYWIATKGAIGRKVEAAMGALTGKGTAPGELRTISHDEVKLVQGLYQK